MSAYAEFPTEFADREALIEALCAVGLRSGPLQRTWVEVHPDGAALVGYQGDSREQRAHVIVRRHHVGSAANDVGFTLIGGRYVAQISAYDERNGLGPEWLGKVKQQYARALVAAKAKKLGYRVKESVQADGSVRMVLAR